MRKLTSFAAALFCAVALIIAGAQAQFFVPTHMLLRATTGGYVGAPVAGYTARYRADGYNNATGAWTDLSGNGFTMTCSSGKANAADANFGSNPSVSFNGTSNVCASGVALSSFVSNSAMTIFVIYRPTALGGTTNSGLAELGLYADAAAGGGFLGAGMNSNGIEAFGFDGATTYLARNQSINTTYGMQHRHSGGTMFLRSSNNATEASSAVGNIADLTHAVSLGKSYDSSHFFAGNIAEVIFYNTALSGANISTNNTYFANSYGVSWL